MKTFLVLIAAMLVTAPAWSQSLASGGPVDIEAAQLEVQHAQGKATFSGNVKVTQGNLTLTAPRLDVSYGASGSGDITQMQASGGVTLTRGGGTVAEKATGNTAIYTPQTQQIVFTGNVTLTRGPSTLSGDKLVYNVASGTARVTSSNGPVKARFIPQK